MTPKTIRLIGGFLAVFVLISVAPAIPEFIATMNGFPTVTLPAISDSLLLAIGGAVLLLGLVVLRQRQRHARAAAQPVTSRSRALARPSADKPLKRAMPEHSGPYPTIASPLQIRLRAAVEKGERFPALARRHNISIDAVRAAVGASAAHAPAGRPSNSFRSSAPSLPAKPRAKPVQGRVSRYQVAT
jgi:hypothetical protein